MNKKIAIYSINFGDYRGEINHGIDKKLKKYDKGIDYYFFTDNKNLKSKHWKVIYVPKLKRAKGFICSTRRTSKFYKFVIPEILHDYDIIVFSDANMVHCCNVSKEKLIDYTKNKKDLILIKHPRRKSSQDELRVTINNSRKNGDVDKPRKWGENIPNGTKFLNQIKNIKFNSIMMETGQIIHCNKKNNKENIDFFKKIYEFMMSAGVRRDQNVLQYMLYMNKFEDKVSYHKWGDLNKL